MPFASSSTLIMEGQAHFQPLRYVRGLAQPIASDRCMIFEDAQGVEVDADDGIARTKRAFGDLVQEERESPMYPVAMADRERRLTTHARPRRAGPSVASEVASQCRNNGRRRHVDDPAFCRLAAWVLTHRNWTAPIVRTGGRSLRTLRLGRTPRQN